MKKNFYYLMLCLLWIGVASCKDEEVPSPATPTFTVDKTSGLFNATEFVFTVDQVSSNDISLLPYGTENPSLGGILISAKSFTNGKATVKFKYGKVGVFNAVVVANNHSTDGKSVKNTSSSVQAITITSDKTTISAFSFTGSTKTTIDQTAKTIAVIVPYGTNVASLKANFTASTYSTVSVGSTAQVSGTTINSFSTPQTYIVKAQDGTTVNYVVTVTVTAVEQLTTFKSFVGTAISKSAKDKVLATALDNAAKTIVLYDTIGTASNKFDSVTVKFELDGKFANAKYGGKKLAQGTLLDLTSVKQITVLSQDSVAGTTAIYNVYAAKAPKLSLAFNTLNPTVTGKPKNFGIAMNVLNGTTVAAIPTTSTIDLPAGVVVTGITADGVPFVSGASVDYTKSVKFELSVTDSNLGLGVSYKVVFTVSVTVLK